MRTYHDHNVHGRCEACGSIVVAGLFMLQTLPLDEVLDGWRYHG